MAGKAPPGKGSEQAKDDARQDRLAAALRANLRRRKDQKRGRDEAQADVADTDTPAPPGEQTSERNG